MPETSYLVAVLVIVFAIDLALRAVARDPGLLDRTA